MYMIAQDDDGALASCKSTCCAVNRASDKGKA